MGGNQLDVRGKERWIAKLWKFHREAFVHMLFYRILILISFACAIVLILNGLTGHYTSVAQALILLVWLLITPQLFGMMKVLAIVLTDGIAFGHLEKSYLESIDRKIPHAKVDAMTVFPYLVAVVWLGLLCLFAVVWFA